MGKLRGLFENAGDEVPLLAVFGHENGGCGTGGGATEDRRYRRGIDSREAVIAFEPDSLGTL